VGFDVFDLLAFVGDRKSTEGDLGVTVLDNFLNLGKGGAGDFALPRGLADDSTDVSRGFMLLTRVDFWLVDGERARMTGFSYTFMSFSRRGCFSDEDGDD